MTGAPAPVLYIAAAVAEIAGCFTIWAWWRMGAPAWWLLPGMALLFAFGWLLALAPAGFAGRSYAAYGGIYVAASLVWMWAVEHQRPDPWDIAGAALTLAGAAVILLAPR